MRNSPSIIEERFSCIDPETTHCSVRFSERNNDNIINSRCGDQYLNSHEIMSL